MTFARPRRALPHRALPVLIAAVLGGMLVASCTTASQDVPAAPAGAGGASSAGSSSAGTSSAGWVVTGLGDSVTAGSACDCDDFVQQYARLTQRATGHHVAATNLGVPGQTSADLADLVRRPDVARQVAGSDIVLITTGANDLGSALSDWQDGSCTQACFDRGMPAITANVAAVVAQVKRLRAGRSTEVLVTDYWNVFLDGQVAATLGPQYQALSDRVTREANAAICAGAVQGGAVCVDLYAPFKGDGSQDPTVLLADDGDHPDADGHRTIAEALAAHGWRELGSPA